MANIKSKKKHVRKTIKNTELNRKVRSRIRTLNKKFQTTINVGNKNEITTITSLYVSSLDKAAKNNIIHKNKVNRLKCNINKAIIDMVD